MDATDQPAESAGADDGRARLRVGFLIDRWQPDRGGAERALARLAEHLEGRGHEVLAFGIAGPRRGTQAPGTFHAVRARGLTRAARERRLAHRLVAAAAAARCDVTVGVRHLARVDVYWPHGGSHVATLAAKHGPGRWYPLLSRHRAFMDLEARLFREGGVKRIVCVSELVRAELANAFPSCADLLAVVPNGVDLERFHPRARAVEGAELRARIELPPDTPLLVHVARNPELKGLPQLLDALAELVDRPWRLLVAGPPRPARWRRAAQRRGLGRDRVLVRAQQDALELAAGADLAVHPTRRDPCSLATLEALACGTPVVTTRANGAAEAITDPACGVVLPDAKDVAALRQAIVQRLDIITGAGRAREGVDRGAVRAAVADRGLAPWLDRLEQVVTAAAAEVAGDERSGGTGGSSS